MKPSPFHLAMVCLSLAPAWVEAGHSRHSYVDGGQSSNGRYVVLPKLVIGKKPKKGPAPYHWEYEWRDRKSGVSHHGRLDGLRGGSSNVFDPVGSHLFVAPDGETFALWTPQVTMLAPNKKPEGERDGPSFQTYEGFTRRLVIYKKTGEILRRFDLKDLLQPNDWQWFHYHQRQTYWLLEYEGLHTRSAPRPFYALYRISSDYTVLEFRIGANAEATHKAKQRGVIPPNPRTVRLRLTDGRPVTLDDSELPPEKRPVRPFTGRLADKTFRQRDYQSSLDPIRQEGRFLPPEDKAPAPRQ